MVYDDINILRDVYKLLSYENHKDTREALLGIIEAANDEYQLELEGNGRLNDNYIDLGFKIQTICKKLRKDRNCKKQILAKSFEYILSNEKRKNTLREIIKNNYLKSNGNSHYLFKNEKDIDLSKVKIEMLERKEFDREHKQELGFVSDASWKKSFGKASCKVLNKEKIDEQYSKNDDFLENMCQGLDLDIQFLFHGKKLFKTVDEYSEYIDGSFNNNEIQSDIVSVSKRGQSHMNIDIQKELNISNNSLTEYIKDFISDNKIEKYNLNTQNIDLIIEVLKKAFLRGLDDKLLLDFIDALEFCDNYERFIDVEDVIIQHEAKVKSNLKKDNESIEILEELLAEQEKQPDKFSLKSYSETLNLLGASYKRYAFDTVNKLTESDGRTGLMIEKLSEAREVYKKASLRAFDDKYYPAINISYLESIIGKLENKDNDKILDLLEDIWEDVDFEINDYWSWITDIEKNIIFQNYRRAKEKIQNIEIEIDMKDVNKFNIDSTVRQLELYSEFCDEEDQKELSEICDLLNNLKESL